MQVMSRWLLIILVCVFTAACGGNQAEAPPTAPAAATEVPTEVPTEAPTEAAPAEVATEAPTEATPEDGTQSKAEAWLTSWMVNTTGETSSIFSGVAVNVSSVYTKTINGKDFQCITASGIPNYKTTITQAHIDSLNNRQRAAEDFGTGATTATVGQEVAFGENIGYDPAHGCTSGQAGYGYWPPGPACPSDQNKEQCFPLDPQPATAACATGLSTVGTWVNGVAIFNWTDGQSYNGEGVWQNEAYHFEINDLDICPGHSARGDYHHHSNPDCLGEQLEDTGSGHSPIYGFAADGYPVYGPWHESGVLAQSCWKTRDYDDPASPTGCGVAGERSCLLVDKYDITKGTTPASSNGPSTSGVVASLSGNQFTTTSGYYYQDYYYDPACTAQGVQYLDKHNGHDHDGLGYHYHTTRVANDDGSYTDVFPFYFGPDFAGTLQEEAITTCSTGRGGPPGGGPGGNRPDFAAVAKILNITEEEFRDALGPPPPDLAAAAEKLGVTLEELQAALDEAGVELGPPGR